MIGIIGAMEEEVSQLIEAMENKEKVTCAGMDFYSGTLKGKDAVVVQSGIGKVNMALCTQILADKFDVEAVINTGVAGGLYKDIEIGDIVISKDAVQHDVDATVFGYKVGEIPRMDTSYFEADKDLIELAKKTCEEVNPDINCYVGRVVSGDQFISGEVIKNKLIDLFDGSCTEMEGAAIAHAAFLNEIPYVVIRAISDKADGSAHMDYPEFERAAAAHSAKLVENLVKRL